MEPFNIDEALKNISDMVSDLDRVLRLNPDDKIAELLLYSAQKLQMRLENAKQKGNK